MRQEIKESIMVALVFVLLAFAMAACAPTFVYCGEGACNPVVDTSTNSLVTKE